MKIPLAFGVSLLLAGSVFGQGRGNYNTYGSFSGFGSVVFPGTGHPPGAGNFSITNPGFAGRLGATVNGTLRGPYGGFNSQRRSVAVVPYAYPVYVGGYGGYDAGYVNGPGYAPQPNVTYVTQPQQPAPQIVINQNFAAPAQGLAPSGQAVAQESDGFHMYQAPGRPASEPQLADPRYYLIAYKDHSIYSALAYWVEANTLHYVTMQNTHNQASLDLVDVEFTKRLNQDRNMPFTLTPSH